MRIDIKFLKRKRKEEWRTSPTRRKKNYWTEITLKNVILMQVGTDISGTDWAVQKWTVYIFGLQYNFVINLEHLDLYEENKNHLWSQQGVLWIIFWFTCLWILFFSPYPSLCLFLLLCLCRAVLDWLQNWKEGTEGSASVCMVFPTINTHTRVVHLLCWINLHWHIIITSSLLFTLAFTLGIVHSVDSDTCIMTYIYHHTE